MLAVVGAAALVLVAGASWELPSAAGEPRGLGEGRASGRESWARLTWVPVRSSLTPARPRDGSRLLRRSSA